jgi:hypothetical protein
MLLTFDDENIFQKFASVQFQDRYDHVIIFGIYIIWYDDMDLNPDLEPDQDDFPEDPYRVGSAIKNFWSLITELILKS